MYFLRGLGPNLEFVASGPVHWRAESSYFPLGQVCLAVASYQKSLLLTACGTSSLLLTVCGTISYYDNFAVFVCSGTSSYQSRRHSAALAYKPPSHAIQYSTLRNALYLAGWRGGWLYTVPCVRFYMGFSTCIAFFQFGRHCL